MTECGREPVAVIGGGVSGMAAAHYLLNQGLSVDLYEAGPRLGGRVCIDDLNGEEICFGGKNIGLQYTEFRHFLRHYGHPKLEYFGINSARLEKGKLKVFNSQHKIKSLMTLLQTAKFSDLKKMRDFLQAVKSDRRNGDLCAPYIHDLKTSGAVSLTSHFSPKFSHAFLRALTVRMNGAEPHQISLENFGTHLQMLQDEYEQVSSSLSSVFEAFAKAKNLKVFLNTPVQRLKHSQGVFSVGTQEKDRAYHNVTMALPAPHAATLLRHSNPSVAGVLRKVRYYPVGVLVADYNQPVFTQGIRALTFGCDSPVSNIGAYGIHHLHRVRYTFSGQAAADMLNGTLDEREFLNVGEAAGRPYFNLTDNPCQAYKMKYWPQGLCGYTQNESAFQTELNKALTGTQGLYLTGDYRKGASMENCFRAAKAAVQSLLSQNHASVRGQLTHMPDKERHYVEN